MNHLRALILLAGLSLLIVVPAFARDARAALVPPGWTIGRVRVEGARPAFRAAAGEHELTIQRRPESIPAPDSDFFHEGTISYGNVRVFNPAPSVDSGRQFPYGLDGIGGYGSDYGTSAWQDDVVYDRGP